jgi:hypothetical protein
VAMTCPRIMVVRSFVRVRVIRHQPGRSRLGGIDCRRSTTPNFEIKPGVVSRVLTTSGELTEYSPDVVSGRISRILTSIRVYPSAEHLYHAVPITLLFCRSPLAPPCWPKNALYVGSRVNHNPYRPPAMRIPILVSASGMKPLPRTCRQMPG